MITLQQHLAAHYSVFVDPDREWGYFCTCGSQVSGAQEDVDLLAAHQEHIALAWEEARTVRTIEELDALPIYTVVRWEWPDGSHTVGTRLSDGCWDKWPEPMARNWMQSGVSCQALWHPDCDVASRR